MNTLFTTKKVVLSLAPALMLMTGLCANQAGAYEEIKTIRTETVTNTLPVAAPADYSVSRISVTGTKSAGSPVIIEKTIHETVPAPVAVSQPVVIEKKIVQETAPSVISTPVVVPATVQTVQTTLPVPADAIPVMAPVVAAPASSTVVFDSASTPVVVPAGLNQTVVMPLP